MVTNTVFPLASTDVEVRTGGGVGVVTGGSMGVKIVGGAVGNPVVVSVEVGKDVRPLEEPGEALVVTGPLTLPERVPDEELAPATELVELAEPTTVERMIVVIYVFVMYVVGAF